jgi:Cu2+-exporting ATPase
VEKAVKKVEGVEDCAVSLLTNSMGVEGSADPAAVIAAVENAGYNASVKNEEKKDAGVSADAALLEDKETPALRRRLIASLGFLATLMYLSMGHMMLGWPLPSFLDGNMTAQGILQMLLAGVVMVVNQAFFHQRHEKPAGRRAQHGHAGRPWLLCVVCVQRRRAAGHDRRFGRYGCDDGLS